MTREDEICTILKAQYHCHCDRTGNLDVWATERNVSLRDEHLLDFCMAVKRLVRL